MSIFGFLGKQKNRSSSVNVKWGRGFLVFENTSEVIRAENILRSNGWKIHVKVPPPEIRTGCDLVIEFPLIEKLNIL